MPPLLSDLLLHETTLAAAVFAGLLVLVLAAGRNGGAGPSRRLWPWVRDRLHPVVKELEPWGILLAVIGLGLGYEAYRFEFAAREEDRRERVEREAAAAENRLQDEINRAFANFAGGYGRIDAWEILYRNRIDVSALKAPDAYLPEATMRGAGLGRADFSGATLARADLSPAQEGDPDFDPENRGANWTDLSDATLTCADLTFARLTGVNLMGVTLTEASLGAATLTGAQLSFATLTSANLSFATLTNALLYFADATGAKGLVQTDALFCATRMPNGSLCNRDCDVARERLVLRMLVPIPEDRACPWIEERRWESWQPEAAAPAAPAAAGD